MHLAVFFVLFRTYIQTGDEGESSTSDTTRTRMLQMACETKFFRSIHEVNLFRVLNMMSHECAQRTSEKYHVQHEK